MEPEILRIIDVELDDLRWRLGKRGRQFTDGLVARAFIWSVMCDRPLTWFHAQRIRSVDLRGPTHKWPSPSTVSRRLRLPVMQWLLEDLLFGLTYSPFPPERLILDSKALPVSPHSKDAEATIGHGRCETQRGYKLHVLADERGRLWAWEVMPMHVDEVEVARLLLPRAARKRLNGIVLTDTGYAMAGRECAESMGFQLVCPWNRRPSTPGGPRWTRTERATRDAVERFFGNLTSFGGGLSGLPAWVRTLRRVRLWVLAKLIINAARQQRLVGPPPGRVTPLSDRAPRNSSRVRQSLG